MREIERKPFEAISSAWLDDVGGTSPAATLRAMAKGGYQGPEPWEIEQAAERGYRRARGEYIPPGGSPNLNPKTCCCLVPAILFALFILGGILAPIIAQQAGIFDK